MLALTRKTDYALVALTALARAAERGEEALSSTALAQRLSLPLPVLRNILKALAAADLLASEQGPFGGYRLAVAPGELSVERVVEVIEGPVALAPCCSESSEPGSPECQRLDACLIKGAVRSLHSQLRAFLRSATIADLARAAEAAEAGPRITAKSHAIGSAAHSGGAPSAQRMGSNSA